MASRGEHEARVRKRLAALTLTCAGIFGERTRWTLEIGCGHGHFLAAYAAEHPGEACVGVDWMRKRLEKAGNKKHRGGLGNLELVKAEAVEFLSVVPNGVWFEKIFVLFPDPWPKARHAKKRLIRESFLDDLAAKTREGSRLYFRSDDGSYVLWSKEHFQRHPQWRVDPEAEWPFRTETFFQSLMKSYSSLVAVRRPTE